MEAIRSMGHVMVLAGIHFTKDLWTRNWNLALILFAVIIVLMTQRGHKFAHVTTAELSWHVQNHDQGR